MIASLLDRRRLPADPAAAQTAGLLRQDISVLQSVKGRRTIASATTIEDAYHLVYASTGPWLGLARSRRDTTDSPADRVRWDVWISALTPSQHSIRGTYAHACVLAGQAREMLRALRETLVPCLSVGSAAKEIERLIQTGVLAPAARIPRSLLVKQLRVPASYVDLALADLAASGLVEIRASGRAAVLRTDGRASASGRRQGSGLGETGAGAA